MESWTRKLRMGMVGGGQGAFIGAVHRTAAALDQQIELVAGCFSRAPANTRETGRQLYLDPARCYATFEEMAAKEAARPVGDRIDFVTIVTPNRTHFAAAKAFLERGIHVLCDKPMTYDVAEAQALVRLVEQTGLVFGVTHNYLGHPLVRHARELFRDGAMGPVRKVMVEYLQDFLMYPHERHGQKQALWRTDPSQAGEGGTLGDCGSHAINLLEYIIGPEVVAVSADRSTFLPGRVLDEDVNLLLRLRGGGKGTMSVSQIATGEENALTIRIYAEKGAIKWAQENPNYLEVYRYGEERRTLTRASAYLSAAAAAATRVPTGHPEGYFEAFATIYAGYVRAIRAHLEGRPLHPADCGFASVYDGLRGMEFIHAAADSAKNNARWVDLG
jgi:predicted dehydrogenase